MLRQRILLGFIFVIAMIGVLSFYLDKPISSEASGYRVVFLAGVSMAAVAMFIDILTPKRRLNALAGVFFGLLVGLLISALLAPMVQVINEFYQGGLPEDGVAGIKWMLGVCICYLTISIVIRTKDDVRFIVPYVEFAKQTKGSRPLVLDTSAIVDGRIADLCQSKLFDAPLLIPRFVLNELQRIADSADKLKRNRGRRGLDVLNKIQSNPVIDVEIDDIVLAEVEELDGVDQKLMAFTKIKNGRLVTTDYNLSKVALVRSVDVVNINDLANSLKVVALPGETMEVKVIKPGEEADQGIGYLDDGTMVVVEGARSKIGRDIVLNVTSSLQTAAGKMIFGKFEGLSQAQGPNDRKKPRRAFNNNRESREHVRDSRN